MTRPRIREVLMVATAAVLTSALTAFAATAPDPEPTSGVTEATEGPSEVVSETVVEEPTEQVVEEEPTETVEPPKDTTVVEPEEETEEESEEPKAPKPEGKGNAHGKAVSAAARGITPPVGDCRNHGHWVSTVAKGLASCDDNPRSEAGHSAGAERATTSAPKPPKPAKPQKPAKQPDTGKPAGRGKP